jgi:hypothetical protein
LITLVADETLANNNYHQAIKKIIVANGDGPERPATPSKGQSSTSPKANTKASAAASKAPAETEKKPTTQDDATKEVLDTSPTRVGKTIEVPEPRVGSRFFRLWFLAKKCSGVRLWGLLWKRPGHWSPLSEHDLFLSHLCSPDIVNKRDPINLYFSVHEIPVYFMFLVFTSFKGLTNEVDVAV